MQKTMKKILLVSLCIIIFFVLFGKIIFLSIMGFLFFGFPAQQTVIENEIGEPLAIGEAWDEEDLFQVTLKEVVFSEEDGKRLCDVVFEAENRMVYSNDPGEMEARLKILVEKDLVTDKTNRYFAVPIGQSKEYHYEFFLANEVSEFQCQVEIPLLDRVHWYKKIWKYGLEP